MSIAHILLEFQDKNYLYHFTSIRNAGEILRSNTLYAGDNMSATNLSIAKDPENREHDKGVSFTRNRRLLYQAKEFISGVFGEAPVGLVFDRQKLQQRYKLEKFDVHGYKGYEEKHRRVLDEEIITKDITNVRNYIEFIYIPVEYITKKFQDISMYLMDLHMDLLDEAKRHNIPMKVFRNGNFKEFEIDDLGADEDTLIKLHDRIFN